VAGLHHLWHMNGHHKLIRHRFVNHGCTGGNTRYVFVRVSEREIGMDRKSEIGREGKQEG
jgi:hypothetical protein